MFAEHFLANRVLVDRWLRDGVVEPTTDAGQRSRGSSRSRSETDRSAEAIDFERFGEFADYGYGMGSVTTA